MRFDDELTDHLELALELAELADGLTLPPYEQRSYTVSWKQNATEVTEIDRQTEAAIVEHLRTARPDDAILGEEHGELGDLDAEYRWIIDPIDGTSGYTRGIPIWATLIALEREGQIECAIVSAPALGARWWATLGQGAFANGQRCYVSSVDRIGDAQVCAVINDGWAQLGLAPALTQLLCDARRGRGLGDFWQHMLVAEGAVDVSIDAIGVEPYDVAAVRLIVEEAGGRFTDRDGAPRYDTGSAISSNGLLHDEVLGRLRVPG